jgi:predicted flap endonuclease-1-like 5' DNA nuclease
MNMIDINPQNHSDAWWQHLLIFAVAGVLGYIIGYRTSGDTVAELEGELGSLDSDLVDCQALKSTLTYKIASLEESSGVENLLKQEAVSEVTEVEATTKEETMASVGTADSDTEETVEETTNLAVGLGIAAIPLVETSLQVAPIKPDNLKKVEGVGPKIQELLNKEGIITFRQLSETSSDTLTEILRDTGTRFQMHDPGTWPKQAQLAADGKWDELKAWQSELDKGRAS